MQKPAYQRILESLSHVLAGFALLALIAGAINDVRALITPFATYLGTGVVCTVWFAVWWWLRRFRPRWVTREVTAHGGAASANKSSDRDLLIQLRRFFDTRFSEDELRTVCFDLGIDYDNLPSMGKAGKARELVAYYERHDSISELIAVARQLRPDVSWADTADQHMPPERLPREGTVRLSGLGWGTHVSVIGLLIALWVPRLFPVAIPLPEVGSQTEITPARPGETLILVAPFDNRSEGQYSGVDPSSPIYDMVLEASKQQGTTVVRVERYSETIKDSASAQAAREKLNASIVIWGWYNMIGIQPYVELAENQTVFGENRYIITPTPLAFFFLEDIPAQSTYLGLFTVGRTFAIPTSVPDLRRAITFFDSAIDVVEKTRTTTKPWEAYVWKANCYAWLSDHKTALINYDKSLALNPEDASGYYNRGVSHGELGDHAAAITDYTKAIKLDPDFAFAYFNRGVNHGALGDHPAAITDYTKAIELDPNFAGAYWARGVSHAALGDHSAAIADYTKAIEFDPNFAYAYFNRGIEYTITGEKAQAIADFEQFLKISTDAQWREAAERRLAALRGS